jgi:plasmid stabilization system protein ParE
VKYTVVWTPTAEDDLAAIWLGAPDRDTVNSAADTIDALLRRDPETRGESRAGTLRILFVPPLGVDFDVQMDDRMVYVLAAWFIG